MTDTVWQSEPPAPARRGTRGRYDWDTIVADLKQKPGEWLLVDKEARLGLHSAINRRKMTALQDPQWDFKAVTRKKDTNAGTCEVWMTATKREE